MAIKKRANGFTLTEMMITVAILGVMAMVGPSMLTNITKFTQLSRARVETQRGARDSLNQINQSLRQAEADTIVVDQATSQPPQSRITFTTIDGRAIQIYQSGRDLKFATSVSSTTLASGLRYIAFTYPRTDDQKIISVSVTFEKDTYQGGTKALQMAIEKVRIMND